MAPQPLDHFKRGYQERALLRDRDTGGDGGRGADRRGSGGNFNRRGSDRYDNFRGGSQMFMGMDVGLLVDAICQRGADVYAELEKAREQHRSIFDSGKAVTAIISNLARRRQMEPALAVWKWVDQVGIRKNTFHYNSMISVCEKVRDFQRALSLLDEMRNDNVRKNEVT